MLYVEGGHAVAEVQGGGTDDEVFEGDGDAFCGLLAFDLAASWAISSETG